MLIQKGNKGAPGEAGTCELASCPPGNDTVGAVSRPGVKGQKGDRGHPGIMGEIGLPGFNVSEEI